MEFAAKYTTDALSKDQIIISKDAFAIGEMLEQLRKSFEELSSETRRLRK